jgi:UDP-N-acetylmuramoyl-L-alanyl-D-glutamate--2,6-diaminopimelate ligase
MKGFENMKLQKLIGHLHLLSPYIGENPEITSVENDNRRVQKGSLFICIKGYSADGHDFAESAVQNGAVAILAERSMPINVPVIIVKDTTRAMAVIANAFYDQPSKKLHLIGITGTNGKTTISHLLEKIFTDANIKTGLFGTMYTKIAEKIVETKNTTPESLVLQKGFHEMVEAGVEVVVMEVSSHALHIGRVHGCDYNVAVFTNLSQDHLDYHQTMAEYLHAKSLLFAQLGNTFNENEPKFAILNIDDPASLVYEKSTAAHIITYGIDNPADFHAMNIQFNSTGTCFDLVLKNTKYPIKLQLVGRFSVYNVLACIAAAYVSKIPINRIIDSVESNKGVAGRFEIVNEGQDFTVIVDYAHTPDSLENVLKTIQQFATKRIFVIIGCGGDRDRTKRPKMAQIACRYATDPIFTSDNPRSEDPLVILNEMEAGVQGGRYMKILDRREAIFAAVKQASKGDVILIAGKGHETYQLIGNKVYDFDDRVVAREAIEER